MSPTVGTRRAPWFSAGKIHGKLKLHLEEIVRMLSGLINCLEKRAI
jgi:hypothetical protein